jgi:GT2 family glycosyltransferase
MNSKRILIPDEAVIGRSDEFRLEIIPEEDSSGRRYFFTTSGGARVATDRVGALIWEALPGTCRDIRARLEGDRESGESVDLSEKMLAEFLFLMIRAGIATSAGAVPGEHPLPAVLAEEPYPVVPVSVIIVTFNSAAHIRACLSSLAVQAVVAREFPLVIVHRLRRNLHYPGGINYGLRNSRGPLLLVLNDDVELDPAALAEMVRVMESAPKAGAVAPMLKFYHLRGFLNGIGNHVRPTGWGSDNFIGGVDVGQFAGLAEVPSACVSAVLLRRSAVDDVGLFDASFRAFYEDPDWCFRARLRGWTIAAAPRAVVYHKFNAHWSGRPSRFRWASRNRIRFVLKNFRGSLFWAFFRSYVKEDAMSFLGRLRKGRLLEAASFAGVYLSLLARLPGDLWKRARIQRRRAHGADIESILALNPVPWSCLNEEHIPKIDVSTYFEYYRWLF